MMFNRIARIKISSYILLILIISFLLQLCPTQKTYAADIVTRYYQQGGRIVFDEENQVLSFISRGRTAVTNIRFRPIGWQIRFEPKNSNYPKFYTRVKNDRIKEEVKAPDGYTYTEYVFPIAPSSNQQYPPSIIEALVRDFGNEGYDAEYFAWLLANGVTIKFDCVGSILEANATVPNAVMDTNGNIGVGNTNPPDPQNRGEHYFTKEGTSFVTNHKVKSGWETTSSWDNKIGENGYKGIKGARPWRDLTLFDDFFDKQTYFKNTQVIVQRIIKAQHWTTDGKRLDAGNKDRIIGVYDIKIGKTENKTVTGLSFPGYKIKYSVIKYNDSVQDRIDGSSALTRTVKLNAANKEHTVIFYYEPVNPDTSLPNGKIIFTPNQSSDIQGNRNGWVNANFDVKVTFNRESVTMYGTEARTYRYYDSCYEVDSAGNCIGKWVDGSVNVPFTQSWKAGQLTVTGKGTDNKGNTINLGPFTISNGGKVTIDKELKDIQLSARVTRWDAQNDKAFENVNPPLGQWTKDKPTQNTSAPNKDYASDSGKYYLDKSSPQVVSVTPASSEWTKNVVNVNVSVSDNLSGLYNGNSYVEAIDTSYYRNSVPKDYFNEGVKSAQKTITLAKEGIYQIKVNLEDIARNIMTEKTYGYYKIDRTRPYDAIFSVDNRKYIDEDLTVTVTVGDNLSGIEEVRYALTNSPNDKSGMKLVNITTLEGQAETKTFTVNITEPGSWWIHVYQKDRAGNITETTSQEYRIIRLGSPDNKDGNKEFNNNDETLWIAPKQTNGKIPRGTRFDVILKVYGLAAQDATITTVNMIVPNWVTNDVMYKINGRYAVTPGIFLTTMNFYSGYEEDAESYPTPTTSIQWWKAFIPPYGTPITVDAKGNRIRDKYQIKVQLEFEGYTPSKTHVSTIEFDVVPETKIKTEIIKNEY